MNKTSARDVEMPDWDIPDGMEEVVAPTMPPVSSATYLRQHSSPLPQGTGRRNAVPVPSPGPSPVRRRSPRLAIGTSVGLLILGLCVFGAVRFDLVAGMRAPASTADVVSPPVLSIQDVPSVPAVPASPGALGASMEPAPASAPQPAPGIGDAPSLPPVPESPADAGQTASSVPQAASGDPALPGGIVPLLPDPEDAAADLPSVPVAAVPEGTCVVTYGHP